MNQYSFVTELQYCYIQVIDISKLKKNVFFESLLTFPNEKDHPQNFLKVINKLEIGSKIYTFLFTRLKCQFIVIYDWEICDFLLLFFS